MILVPLLFSGLTAVMAVSPPQASPAKSSKVEYPRVRETEGAVTILQKGEPLKGKLPGQLLREQVLITTEKGRARIDLSSSEFVIVSEKSELLVPAIDWDTGLVEELEIRRGSFGVEMTRPRQIRSALYRDRVDEGRYIFDFNPQVPQMGVTVLRGNVLFRGLETEERREVASGERQSFIGELAEGQIQYDVLLEGRKVARGKLGPKEKLKVFDVASFEKGFEFGAKSKKNRLAGKSSPESAAAHAKATIPGGLCKHPGGKFNDCSYTCINNPKGSRTCLIDHPKVECVRKRCLASGEWGDEFTFAKHLAVCDAKVVVRPCDY